MVALADHPALEPLRSERSGGAQTISGFDPLIGDYGQWRSRPCLSQDAAPQSSVTGRLDQQPWKTRESEKRTNVKMTAGGWASPDLSPPALPTAPVRPTPRR